MKIKFFSSNACAMRYGICIHSTVPVLRIRTLFLGSGFGHRGPDTDPQRFNDSSIPCELF
jgi:hypothetical protein